MTLEYINPRELPTPTTYTQVVVARGARLIFVAGQEPEDLDGKLVGPGDLAVYGAPVLSHYEFEMDAVTRLTDTQWKTNVLNNAIPPAPEWTQSYLVPKP